MKKTALKGLFAFALSAIAMATSGCVGGGQEKDEENTIKIYLWESGLGSKWLKNIVNDFNESQNTYKAKLTTSTSANVVLETLTLGRNNSYDLYFTMLQNFQYYEDFIDLSDVLDSPAYGESASIKDKYYPGYIKALEDEKGGHKVLSFGNNSAGIVYNRNMIKDNELPRTTNELGDLVTDLAGKGISPWLFFSENGGVNGYWNYVSDVWEAQYNGLDYHYNRLMKLADASGNSPSKETMLAKDGRYEALKVMEEILTPNTAHKQCTSTSHTTVQTLYLSGQAAMMVNGSWILNETGSSANVGMMKTPVISSIVKTLEDKTMDDEKLANIVSQVDEGKESSDLCSQKDFDRIKEARNTIYNNGAESYIFTPSYSNVIPGVKEFLKFYHSDASTMRFIEATGLPSAVKLTDDKLLDRSSLSDWTKSMFDLADKTNPLLMHLNRSSVFTKYGVNEIANIATAQPLIASNPKDRKNADQLWQSLINKVNENWGEWTA